MNPLVDELIVRQRMASLQEEADRWRLGHPRPRSRPGRFARLLSAAFR